MRVKLIWEFRGGDAVEIAKHHAKHLEEFADQKSISGSESGVETGSKYFSIAFLIVDEKDSEEVINILRPHKKQEFGN